MPEFPPISVVIPAYNEDRVLGPTLGAVFAACRRVVAAGHDAPEILVVDNASTDATAEVAEAGGASVVYAPKPGIAAARNAGAKVAAAPRLFFLDADTWIPPGTLVAIISALDEGGCVGGAPATEYRYRKRVLRPYMAMWAVVARRRSMAQGVGQFVTAEAFHALRGYNEELHMAEDSDFYWRLQSFAGGRGQHVLRLAEVTIVPSSRRLDEWPAWKTILLTNPVTTSLMRRSPRFWNGWRQNTVR
jgi:glycosyltransferase involved in cell wall biosynthesis